MTSFTLTTLYFKLKCLIFCFNILQSNPFTKLHRNFLRSVIYLLLQQQLSLAFSALVIVPAHALDEKICWMSPYEHLQVLMDFLSPRVWKYNLTFLVSISLSSILFDLTTAQIYTNQIPAGSPALFLKHSQ